MSLFSNKEYQKEDYVFTDKNGETYISTPELDVMGELGNLIWVCFISIGAVFGILYYHFVTLAQ